MRRGRAAQQRAAPQVAAAPPATRQPAAGRRLPRLKVHCTLDSVDRCLATMSPPSGPVGKYQPPAELAVLMVSHLILGVHKPAWPACTAARRHSHVMQGTAAQWRHGMGAGWAATPTWPLHAPRCCTTRADTRFVVQLQRCICNARRPGEGLLLLPIRQSKAGLAHKVRAPRHWIVQESYSITSGVLDADPFAGGAYPVHLAAAVELRRTSDLFLLGHRCSFRLRTDERIHTLQGRPGLQLSSCQGSAEAPMCQLFIY
jgi:hypothetical protein